MSNLKNLKNISEHDKRLLQEAESLMGPEPEEMGVIKNMFWGRYREDLMFPYPKETAEERRECDQILEKLENYLRNEHPSIEIDQEQYIPDWVIKKLFDLGIMGMTIPKEYGGLGLGVTSYNRILQKIGQYCASTSVLVSAHQSIGCKAIMLYGTEEQKNEWLPRMAKTDVSAFCLSEPNVGSDAGGQETRAELSEDGEYFILNGDKKWSTSGAFSGMFTVMCKQRITSKKTGKESDKVTALILTPDMKGVDIYEENRSKCGIRGTWQARIKFSNVKVPRKNVLHTEGRGLNVALTCLNYGRATLSAGTLGAAFGSAEQAIKWGQTRYQFGQPLAANELIKQKIARMVAYNYAMDAMLYFTTGMLDRGDKDIMVETAVCKVFCSEMSWRVVNDALQIMGGDGYMTEHELERAFRDCRIYTIVEGANELMQSFIFGYGGKQLAEQLVGLQFAYLWDKDQSFGGNIGRIVKNAFKPALWKIAIPVGLELFLGIKKAAPSITNVHASLQPYAHKLSLLVQELSHQFKKVSKTYEEAIVSRQALQARLGDNAMWIHAIACTISKLDSQIKAGEAGLLFERDKAAAIHFMELAETEIRCNVRALYQNADESMLTASAAAIAYSDSLPNSLFYIHEKSPVAQGTGRPVPKEHILQFPGDSQKKSLTDKVKSFLKR